MLVPYLTFEDPRAAMALYEKAFGAVSANVMDGPGGMVMHAEMEIGGQKMMLSGIWPGMPEPAKGRSPVNFMLYVDNADAALKRAVDAGMTSQMEPEEMFWGDRIARVSDGLGFEWTLAQQIEEVSPDELQKRAAAFVQSIG